MSVGTDTETKPTRADLPNLPAGLPNEPYYRRNEQTRRWGGILVLLGVVWLVFALGSRSSLPGIGLVEQSETPPAWTFNAHHVVVVGANDHLHLLGSESQTVQVAAVRHGFGLNANNANEALEQVEVATHMDGDTLRIELRRPPFVGLGRSPYAELTIELPAGVSAEAHLSSGDISVAQVHSDLNLVTVSGRIEASDTTGALAATLTSGELDIHGHSGTLNAESVSGDMIIDGQIEQATVKTVSGDVSLSGSRGSVTMSSISGDLRLEHAQQATLDLESTSGDIEATVNLHNPSTSQVSNISGDVEVILEQADQLALDMTTASGNIQSNLGDTSADRRNLRVMRGNGSTGLKISTTSGDLRVHVNGE